MKKERVELHLHTNMSAMDGINTASEYIKDAAKKGMSAIAITDHAVIQAFPEAYNAAQIYDMKLIYGMECNLINDIDVCISGKADSELDGEFVVVDIETTGLNPKIDKITEIAACKVNNGEIVDRFCSLVNPEIGISADIVELTGITNEMVKDADKVEDVLKAFLDFCGNAIIVAHNAEFDLSFIKQNLSLCGIEYNPTVIDTLTLSRGLLPGLKRFRLNDVCEALKIELNSHHRADNDAEADAFVFIEFCKLLKDKGVSKVQDIESAIEPYYNGPCNHASVLVKNKYGLKNLYKLVSLSHTEYFYKTPRVPKSELEKYRGGLLIGSGCECGELYAAVAKGKTFDECCEIARFYDYLEVVPIGNFKYFIEQQYAETEEDLININKSIIEIGKHISRPVVAVGDVHFLYSDDGECRKIIMQNKGFAKYDSQPEMRLRGTEDMLEEFPYLNSEDAYEIVVENTNAIADMIENTFEPFPMVVNYPKMDDAEERMTTWSYIGARKKYGEKLPSFVEERLDWELKNIKENGYADLYLIAAEVVKPSKRRGYLVGNRGGMASSLVAYFLEITEINPLSPHYYCEKCGYSELCESAFCGCDLPNKSCPACGEELTKDGFNIPAETFMGADGDREPNFDYNFAPEIIDEVSARLRNLFGENSIVRAGTISTLEEEAAFRYSEKYACVNKHEYSCERMNEYINRISKVKSYTGMQPYVYFIVPKEKELLDFTPVQHLGRFTITHFDYRSLNNGLYKLDLSLCDMPVIIKKLEQLTGVNPEKIPLNDKETMELFSIGKTCGVPEFYSDFIKGILLKTGVHSFDDLIRISGLSRGMDVWIGNGEYDIQEGNIELSDIISTRDDITLYLEKNGYGRKEAFKIAERVRKGIGLTEEQKEEMYQNEIPEWYIDSCNIVKYLIPRAYAASGALLAYRVAYYKAHYPLEFYCAYFTLHADEFDADLLVNNSLDLKKKIAEYKERQEHLERELVDIMETCQEMYGAGFNFVSDTIKNDSFESFLIEDGKLRPKLKYN